MSKVLNGIGSLFGSANIGRALSRLGLSFGPHLPAAAKGAAATAGGKGITTKTAKSVPPSQQKLKASDARTVLSIAQLQKTLSQLEQIGSFIGTKGVKIGQSVLSSPVGKMLAGMLGLRSASPDAATPKAAAAAAAASLKNTLSELGQISSAAGAKVLNVGSSLAKSPVGRAVADMMGIGSNVRSLSAPSAAAANLKRTLSQLGQLGLAVGTKAKDISSSLAQSPVGRVVASMLGLDSAAASAAPGVFASDKAQKLNQTLMAALNSIDPSTMGAGPITRKQNGVSKLSPSAASAAIAQMDLSRAKPLDPVFQAAELVTGVPAVIGEALASRETHVDGPHMLNPQTGMSLDKANKGYGIMQVDQKAHPGTAMGAAGIASLTHIEQAERIFSAGFAKVQQQHPSWTPAQQLQAAFDRYNGDLSSNLKRLDGPSTGHDYGGDAADRAQTFEKDGL